MSRHPIWDLLPGFPQLVDPDNPAHQDHPEVRSLIANGGMWKGHDVGWVLADPRTILSVGEGVDPTERARFLALLADHRANLIKTL